MIHPALKRYFETELQFLGSAAIQQAQAGIALWRAGQMVEGETFIESSVAYAVRAGHAARTIFRERLCEVQP